MSELLIGDCRETMRRLIADGVKVQTCVTSPPYWGLRDYGHEGQLGLEPTPQEYVANMVEVFGLVRELLADDGTLWLNLGDSYGHGTSAGRQQSTNPGVGANCPEAQNSVGRNGLKAKDLVGIPWRVAFALQADGWYLRQDIIWHKPNPMPESVTDRCTKAHEYLFLMAKSGRYYYDAAAIAEKSVSTEYDRTMRPAHRMQGADSLVNGRNQLTAGASLGQGTATRNRRSVWTVPTVSYSEAHFATYPPALIEPCILAGSRPGDIVFDPFFGSGTTGEVAQRLGREWIGCELNPEYGELAERRTSGTIGLQLVNA